MNKPKAQREHFRKRLRQRYPGLEMTPREIREIASAIRNGNPRARCVHRESLTRTHWEVEFKGEIIRLVYDKKRSQVITALPREGK